MSDIIFKITILVTLANALYFLFLVDKKNRIVNIFGTYIVVCALAEIAAYFTAGSNNLYLMPFYNALEFAILSWFFILIHKKSPLWLIGVGLGLVLIALNSVFLQDLNVFSSNSKVLIYILFISLSLYTLFTLFDKHQDFQNHKTIKFFIFGLLINFSGSFILYLFANVISQFSIETQRNLWYLNIMLNIVSQLLFFVGLLKYKKTKSA